MVVEDARDAAHVLHGLLEEDEVHARVRLVVLGQLGGEHLGQDGNDDSSERREDEEADGDEQDDQPLHARRRFQHFNLQATRKERMRVKKDNNISFQPFKSRTLFVRQK